MYLFESLIMGGEMAQSEWEWASNFGERIQHPDQGKAERAELCWINIRERVSVWKPNYGGRDGSERVRISIKSRRVDPIFRPRRGGTDQTLWNQYEITFLFLKTIAEVIFFHIC
jgi:hypothetical protein